MDEYTHVDMSQRRDKLHSAVCQTGRGRPNAICLKSILKAGFTSECEQYANANTACKNKRNIWCRCIIEARQTPLLCDKCFANSQTLSIDYWYFIGNSHTCLDVVSVCCRGKCWTVYKCTMFCLTSLLHASFAFAFRCKPGLMHSPFVLTLPHSILQRMKNLLYVVHKWGIQ